MPKMLNIVLSQYRLFGGIGNEVSELSKTRVRCQIFDSLQNPCIFVRNCFTCITLPWEKYDQHAKSITQVTTVSREKYTMDSRGGYTIDLASRGDLASPE